jgi:hypothetical protein
MVVAVLTTLVMFDGCSKREIPIEPGDVTALATTSADERDPVWSPDGSKIFSNLITRFVFVTRMEAIGKS